jgi:hypothetical protein
LLEGIPLEVGTLRGNPKAANAIAPIPRILSVPVRMTAAAIAATDIKFCCRLDISPINGKNEYRK